MRDQNISFDGAVIFLRARLENLDRGSYIHDRELIGDWELIATKMAKLKLTEAHAFLEKAVTVDSDGKLVINLQE